MRKGTCFAIAAAALIGCLAAGRASAAPAHRVIDSLHAALRQATHDTARVRILLALSAQWRDTVVLTALNCATRAGDIARGQGWTAGQFDAGFAVGQCYDAVEQWDKALSAYSSLRPLAEASGLRNRMRFAARLSESFKLAGHSDSSFYYRMKAVGLARELRDTVAEANLFIYLGGDESDRKNFRQAIHYWLSAVAAAQNSRYRNHEAMPLNNIGEAYLELGKYDSAYAAIRQGLAVMQGSPQQYTTAHLFNTLGAYYRKTRRPDSAAAAFGQARLTAMQPGGSREALEAALKELSEVYDSLGRAGEALLAYRQYIAVRDSNRQEARIAEDARSVLRYEYGLEANAREAERLRLRERSRQQQHTITIIGISLLAAGLLAAFLWYALLQNRRKVRIIAAQAGLLQRQKERIQTALEEKDMLMKEIHHRVKNNLQVISALQEMQASRSPDPQVKEALRDSQNRVLSIAFIHHNLYQHNGLQGVEMQSFVKELAGHILDISSVGRHISLCQDIAEITLDIDTAVPLGLIINELFTNSCKHAFAGRDSGRIAIGLRSEGGGSYILEYEDDGPGLRPGVDLQKAGSLGLKLVSQLTAQLDGSLHYSHEPKSRFILAFKDFESRNTD